MAELDDFRILVGVIGKPRGNRGEVYVEPCTDFPGERFSAPGTLVLEADRDGGTERREVALEESRWIGERLVLSFRGTDSIDRAETLRGGRLYAGEGEMTALAEGSYYHHQLLGLAVVGEDGGRLGTVDGLLRTAAGDILEVVPATGGDGEAFLIPAVEEFCYDVDLSEGVIRVRLPDGLLEINR